MLATTPRTGSTLLARALWATGWVGAPKEYLNPTQLRDWEVRFGSPTSRARHQLLRGRAVGLAGRLPWSEARVATHLDRIATHRASASGQVGLKLHHHHRARHLPGDSAHRLLPGARWIRLTRADRLGQAISWVRARQTGRWASHEASRRAPRYSTRALKRALDAIDQGERGWDRLLNGHSVLRVSYEQLTADPLAVVNTVLDWLDEPPVHEVSLQLQPQADATSEIWRARFVAERERS